MFCCFLFFNPFSVVSQSREEFRLLVAPTERAEWLWNQTGSAVGLRLAIYA